MGDTPLSLPSFLPFFPSETEDKQKRHVGGEGFLPSTTSILSLPPPLLSHFSLGDFRAEKIQGRYRSGDIQAKKKPFAAGVRGKWRR